MPLLQTTQGKLVYAGRGTSSPPLVCLHGAGGNHRHWGYQLRDLCPKRRILTFDLPGHGRSPEPGCKRIEDYGNWLLTALDILDIEQTFIAGHSMGGMIALWVALHAPERVAGLILTSTGARLKILPLLLENLANGGLNLTVQTIVQRGYGKKAAPELVLAGSQDFKQVKPTVFYGDFLACNEFNVMDKLGRITCPTLILCGEEDEVTPPKFSLYLQKHIPRAKLVIIPEAGHMLPLEKPIEVSAEIGNFLETTFQDKND